MDNYTLTIKVDGGDLFEGDLNQWEDCLFSFPIDFSVNEKINQIQDFCAIHNYKLDLSFKSVGSKIKVVVQ